MLILIFTIMLFGVVTNNLCPDFCECDTSLTIKLNTNCQFNRCQLNSKQQHLVSQISENETVISFPDPLTVVVKTSDSNLNISKQNWVKTLILSENNFTEIPEFVSEFVSVQILDLSQNSIESIDTNSFRTFNLKQLNLSANCVSSLSNISSVLSNLTVMDLSNNNLSLLEVVDLPELQYLNLSNNNIKMLDGYVFDNTKLLLHLDVSENNLVRIGDIELPNLSSLLIGGNVDLGTSRDIFFVGSGRKLQTLDASRTGLQQVPAILTHSIRHLALEKNLIQTINRGDFDSYPLLDSLDVTSNDIKFMEEDSLGRLEFLSVLYLTDNLLEEIPRRLPEKLKVLRLDINKIAEIRKKDLQGLPVLEVLFLNDNNITVINEGAFSELISLVSLDLSRNPIINLRAGILSGPLSLQVLKLSSIKISGDDEDSQFPLSVPERLVALNLSSSPGLTNQFLSDTATLMAAKRLQELDLTGGNLEFIRQDLQFFLPQLKLLYLNGNKFNDSQINWLKSWLCVQAGNDEVVNSTRSSADDNYEFLNLSTPSPPERDLKQFEEKRGKTSQLSEYALTSWHVNEEDFGVNEVYHAGVVSKFSQDLFPPYKKYPDRSSRDGNNEIVRSGFRRAIDKSEDFIKWNTSEISMYKSENKNYFFQTLFLVISTALIVFAVSVVLIVRLFKIRRTHVEDIEATALPTISDLW